MCQGRGVYQGPPSTIIPYFGVFGYKCEVHNNPADFALDVLIDASQTPAALETYGQAYEKSSASEVVRHLHKELFVGIDPIRSYHRANDGGAARGFGPEIFYVAQRTLKNTFRNPAMFVSQILVTILLALLIGVVYYDMEKTIEPGVQNRQGAIFFIIISQLFMASSALEPLLKERALFLHVSYLSTLMTNAATKKIVVLSLRRNMPVVIIESRHFSWPN